MISKNSRGKAALGKRHPVIAVNRLALEQRILLDGAAATSVDPQSTDTATAIAPVSERAGQTQRSDAARSDSARPDALAAVSTAMPDAAAVGREILVIDASIEDWAVLAEGVPAHVEVVVLERGDDGLQRIAAAVEAGGPVSSLQIVSHGAAGEFTLGDIRLNLETLHAVESTLARIGAGLAPGADLLLYGCDVGAGEDGQRLLDALASATGADVAASDDATGAQRLGGDWDLERATGVIEARSAIGAEARAAFDGLLAPGPSAVPLGGGEVLLGEAFTFSVSFDNTSPTDTGYAPYIDVFVPARGADGTTGGGAPDGLVIGDASYLGVTLVREELTITATDVTNGFIDGHPYFRDAANQARVSIPPGYQAGDRLIVYQLPFGSFTPNQPAAQIEVQGTLSDRADVGAPLTVTTRAGFRYGADALDNPATDPSVQGPESSTVIEPVLYRVTTTYLGPEHETASGPNYVRGYRIDVDIAEGQTLTGLNLSSVLHPGMQFTPTSGVPATVGGVAIGPGWTEVDGVLVNQAATASNTPSDTVPGGTVTRAIASVTGTASEVDASMVVQFHVPEFYADGSTPILDPATGDSVDLVHGTALSADWDPLDARDANASQAFVDASSHTLEVEALALQKGRNILTNVGPADVSPGDLLQYTLALQVSDYFAVGGDPTPAGGAGSRDFLVRDTLSDGLVFRDATDGASNPTLNVVRDDGTTDSYTLVQGVNYSVTTLADGRQEVVFDLRSTVSTGVGQVLVGDLFGGDARGRATEAFLDFQASVLDSYRVAPPDETGAPIVGAFAHLDLNEGDRVVNNAQVEATILDGSLDPTLPGLFGEADDTRVGDQIASNQVAIAIVGRNGVSLVNDPADPLRVQPGDDITYRVSYTVPTGDFEDFELDAYLPLPIFDAEDPQADGVPSGWAPQAAFTENPAVGEFTLRASRLDNSPESVALPTASAVAGANGVRFAFADRVDATDTPLVIEVFFTVRASDKPFADGLFLAAQAQQAGVSTGNQPLGTQSIDRLLLAQPDVMITRGVVQDDVDVPTSTFDPAYSPVDPGSLVRPAGDANANPLLGTVADGSALDANVANLDAGDDARFAIVLTNVGGAGAYNVTFSDAANPVIDPSTATRLNIVRGDGTVLYDGSLASLQATVRHANGAVVVDEGDALAGLLGDGLQLIDVQEGGPAQGPALAGAFDAGGNPVAAGGNVIVVTYDARVRADVGPNVLSSGSASLTRFSGSEAPLDGTPEDHNHLAAPRADGATIITPMPSIQTQIISTDRAFTAETNGAAPGNRDVVVGEIVVYETVIRVPEGTTSGARFIAALDAGEMSFVQLISADFSSGVSSTSGAVFTALVPADDAGGSANRLVFDFGDLVNTNDDNSAVDTVTLRYSAVVTNTSTNQTGSLARNSTRIEFNNAPVGPVSSTVDVRVVEPVVTITNTPDVTVVDAGDTVTYTVVLSNTGPVPAFEVNLLDSVPAGMTLVPGSLTQLSGPAASTPVGVSGSTISGSWAELLPTQAVTVSFQATVDTGVAVAQVLDHSAQVDWSTLPGTSNDDLSTYVTGVDRERTGAGGVDDHVATDNAPVAVTAQPPQLTLVATSEATSASATVVPGEVVRLRMVVELPESTAAQMELRPQLPPGLRYVNDGSTTVGFVANEAPTGIDSTTLSGASLDLTGGGTGAADIAAIRPVMALPGTAIVDGSGTALPSGVVLPSGAEPVFRLGDLTNNDSDADREFVVVEFNAIVENEAVNVDGHAPSVTASYATAGVVRGTSAALGLTVDEPAIVNLDKTVVATSGDQVTFEVSYRNTGSQTAHDVRLTDDFAGATNIVFDGPAGVVLLPPGATDASDADTLIVTLPSVAPNETVTVRYTATVTDPQSSVPARDAVLDYTSLSAAGTSLPTDVEDAAGIASVVATATTGERSGDTGAHGGAVNTYRDQDPAGLGTISGRLWDDTLAPDTAIDAAPAENLLAGVTVQLRAPGADGTMDTADDVLRATTTDAQGRYAFGMLAQGDYRIEVPTDVLDAQSGQLDLAFERTATGAPRDGRSSLSLGDGADAQDNDFGFIKRNAAPTISGPFGASLDEDTPLVLGGAQALSIADPDLAEAFNPAVPPSNFRVSLGAAHGVLEVTAAGGVIVTGNASGSVVLEGSVADVNATLDGLRYTPDADFNGSDAITMVVDDRGNFGDADGDLVPGEPVDDNLQATRTITLAIAPMPDPPVANPDARSTDEDTARSGAAIAPDASQLAAGDQTDTDPDMLDVPNLEILQITGIAAGNVAGPVAGGVGAPVVGSYGSLQIDAAGNYTWTPDARANGLAAGASVADVFTYTLTDSQGNVATSTITVTIAGLNDAPSAQPDARAIGEDDAPISGHAIVAGLPGEAVDVDPDGDTLTVQGVASGNLAGPLAGGTGTPVVGAYGSLTLNPDGSYTYATDARAQPLQAGDTALDVFTYTVRDPSGQTSTTTIAITIVGDNDNLVANPDLRVIDEPIDAATLVPIVGNVILGGTGGEQADTDIDNDPITAVGVARGTVAGPIATGLNTPIVGDWGTLLLQADGSYTWTPGPQADALALGEVVEDVFTYTVTDLTGDATTQLTIRINGVNDAPTANPDRNAAPADASAQALGNVIGAGAADDRADTDPDASDVLAVVGVQPGDTGAPAAGNVGTPLAGSLGTLTLGSDGAYAYLADAANAAVLALPAGATLEDVFTYTVADGHGGTATTTLTITIEGRNDPPSSQDRSFTISEDLVDEGGAPLPLPASVFAFDDPDTGDQLSAVRIDALPASGTLTLDGLPVVAGQVVPADRLAGLAYRPAPDANRDNLPGPPQVVFSVIDGGGRAALQPSTFTIDIVPVNDPPRAPSTVVTIDGDARADTPRAGVPAFGIATDPDLPAQQLTLTVVDLPPAGHGQFRVDGAPITVGQMLTNEQLQRLQFVPDPALATPPDAEGNRPAGAMRFVVDDGNGGQAAGEVVVNVRPVNTITPPSGVITGEPGIGASAGLRPPPPVTADALMAGLLAAGGPLPFEPLGPGEPRDPAAPTGLLSSQGAFAPILSGLGPVGTLADAGAQREVERILLAEHEYGILSPIALVRAHDTLQRQLDREALKAAADAKADEDCIPAKPKPKPKPRAVTREMLNPAVGEKPATFSDRLKDEGKRFKPPVQAKPRPAPIC